MEINNTNTELFHKIGTSQNGQCLYEVRDNNFQQYKKFIVPKENVDKFEKLNLEISESFEGMTPEKFVQKGQSTALFGAASGVILSLFAFRNSSAFKKIIGMTGSAALFGLGSTAVYMSNVLFKALNYDKKLKAINVRPYNENTDKDISFTGTVFQQVKGDEAKELINMFYNAFRQNVQPNSKLPKFLNKLDNYICTKPFLWMVNKPQVLTIASKTDGKISGGYSMTIMPDRIAHLNFITLSSDKIGTRSGVEILKQIGSDILNSALINDVEKITFSTNQKNKQIKALLKRFSPEKVRDLPLGESEYAISTANMQEVLKNVLY